MIFNNIGFIGAGKVGTSLAMYFKERGYHIEGMYSKNQTSLKESCEFIKAKNFSSMEDLVSCCHIIFITTPDDVIPSISEKISYMKNLNGKFFCHCSGSLSSTVLSNINNSGAYVYSLHPLWAFHDKFTSYKNFSNAYFSLEGSIEAIHIMKDFIFSLGNNFFLLSKDNKSLYHAATVTVSNFVLALIKQGCDYLKLCGVDEKDAMKSLTPLILNNIENFKAKGLPDAITGPVERCDLDTISHHLHSIPKNDMDLYKNLSRKLLHMAEEKNSARDYSALDKIL